MRLRHYAEGITFVSPGLIVIRSADRITINPGCIYRENLTPTGLDKGLHHDQSQMYR